MKHVLRRPFVAELLITAAALCVVWIWMRGSAFTFAVLAILEMAVSGDNAVVNARRLSTMDAASRRWFRTWGMVIAVVGVRFVLPVLLVAVAGWVNPVQIAVEALGSPERYAERVALIAPIIHAFGGVFLAGIFLRFFGEPHDASWVGFLERPLSKLHAGWRRAALVALGIGLVALAAPQQRLLVALASVAGAALQELLGIVDRRLAHGPDATASGRAAIVSLELIDMAFSVDSILAAFALTSSVLVIVLALALGAVWVRGFTVHMVRADALASFPFLEHGAHWGIGLLAFFVVLDGAGVHVPDGIAGLLTVAVIVASVISSSVPRDTTKIVRGALYIGAVLCVVAALGAMLVLVEHAADQLGVIAGVSVLAAGLAGACLLILARASRGDREPR